MSPKLVLIVAVLATTYAGPIVRFAAAPALAIALWRMVLSLVVITPLAVRQHTRWPSGRALMLMGVAGILLAAHFWTWIASLRMTSVASSVALVSTRPIFAWLIAAVWLGERPGLKERWGITVAVLGMLVIGVADAGLSRTHVQGDALALAGALAVAAYAVIGRRVRREVGVWEYVALVYGVAAATLAVFGALQGTELWEFPTRDWLIFAAMAAGPMLLGHTGMNYALKYLPATTVNLAFLGEVVGAALIAWVVPAIGEVPSPAFLVGGGLVLTGIALSLSDTNEDR